jgi:hypothetical protein
MDATSLYREEIYTDRQIGPTRATRPATTAGTPDSTRASIYLGEAQIYTTMGTLPLSFELEAKSLSEAVAAYAPAAKEAVERAVRELEEMRRQAQSSIVVPRGGGLPPGPMGGGKIQMP